MDRQNISSGGPWEDIVGYSRAVRVGDHVWVAGTTSANPDGTIHGDGDMYAQARRALEIIGQALEAAGSALEHVVRTRIFVTDISRWEDAGRAHGEVFATIKPAATMVEVNRLLTPGMLIEIEADAVIP